MENIKTFIIDYTRPDGVKNFSCVQADDILEAIQIFRSAGVDGWSGFKYCEYHITGVTER